MQFKRMWINSPSTLQPYHNYHARNVIVMIQGDGKTLEPDGKDSDYVRAAFTHGDSISIRINKMLLSDGWNPKDIHKA